MTQLPPPRHIERVLRQIDRLARQQGAVISCINSLMELLMPGMTELSAKIAELRQAITDDQTSDQAVVDRLDQVIADLKAGADTQAAIDALEEAKAQIAPVSSPNT